MHKIEKERKIWGGSGSWFHQLKDSSLNSVFQLDRAPGEVYNPEQQATVRTGNVTCFPFLDASEENPRGHIPVWRRWAMRRNSFDNRCRRYRHKMLITWHFKNLKSENHFLYSILHCAAHLKGLSSTYLLFIKSFVHSLLHVCICQQPVMYQMLVQLSRRVLAVTLWQELY